MLCIEIFGLEYVRRCGRETEDLIFVHKREFYKFILSCTMRVRVRVSVSAGVCASVWRYAPKGQGLGHVSQDNVHTGATDEGVMRHVL